jgi:hypothetical protein
MKKSILALSILLSSSAMADYRIIMSGNGGNIKLPESPEPQTDFVSHTFTNCGQTGRYGPSLSQCQSAYSGDEILNPEYNYDLSQGIQYWTVPVTASYEITAAGAKGGDGGVHKGGAGAIMMGVFELTEGQRLKILVGQMGVNTMTVNQGSGGGGGTFVAKVDNTPLIVAGGGGGAARNYEYGHGDGGDAPVTNTGTGAGVSAGTYGNGNGAGFIGNGESALSFVNNGIGGDRYHDGNYGAVGGFGGGAGDSNHLGGGGGGYNGGIGGTLGDGQVPYSGIDSSGGGSFNAGQNQSNQAGANSGHGYVIIKLL